MRRERHVCAGEHPIVSQPPPHTALQSTKNGLDIEGNCRLAPQLTVETAAEVDEEDSEDDHAENPYAAIEGVGSSLTPPEHCLLDYFGCEDTDPFKLVSVFGALSFAIYGTFEHAARIQERARQKYKIDPSSKKTKLPLKKLFKWVTTPGTILDGKQIQLLLVHDHYFKRDAAFEECKRTATPIPLGLSDWRWSDYMAPLPALVSTPRGHIQPTIEEKNAVLVALRIHGLGAHPEPAHHTLRAATDDITASILAASDTSRLKFANGRLSWTPLRFNPSRYSAGFVVEEGTHIALPDSMPPAQLHQPAPIDITNDDDTTNPHTNNNRRSATKRSDPLAHSSFKSSLVNTMGGSANNNRTHQESSSNITHNMSAIECQHRFALAREIVQVDHSDEMAFQGKIYPNVEMGDTGLPMIIGAGLHSAFPRNRFRFVMGVIVHLLVIGCCVAVLYISTTSYSSCCVSASGPFGAAGGGSGAPQCTMVVQDANITGDDVLVAQCNNDICTEGGDVASSVPYGFFWGGWLSLGRTTVIVLLLSVLGIITGVCASFYSTRPVALDNAHPRFWRFVYVAHIIECAIAVALSVFILLELDKETHPVQDCDILGKDTHLTNLCRAEYENCDIILVGYFSSQVLSSVVALPYFSYIIVGLAILVFFVSLIPPGPTEDVMETQMHAIPDTAVFRVGPFAPDGITDQQIKSLQAEIRAKWRREKFAAALSKVKASGKGSEMFNTGTKKSRLDLNDVLTRGKQSGKTDMFRITQLLRLGHGDGKSLMKYRHPDPFLSHSSHKLPPSLEANVNAITHAVLSRLRQQHGGNIHSGSIDPIAMSTTLQLASFNNAGSGGGATLPPTSIHIVGGGGGNGGSADDADSVKIGSPNTMVSPSYPLGGGRKAVSFQEMMRGLDEEKMEDALFDNKLRIRIIEEIVNRVEGERYGDVAQQQQPLSPQGFSMNTIQSQSSPQQQISPPRYDEITAFSPPGGNAGRDALIKSAVVNGRKTGRDGYPVTGRKVSLHVGRVGKDLVRLRKQVRNDWRGAIWVGSFRPVK